MNPEKRTGGGETIAATLMLGIALWEGKIQASAAALESAYAKIEKGLSETRAFMANAGFGEIEYDIGAVQMNRYQDREAGDITYYLVSTIKVQSADIEKIKSLSNSKRGRVRFPNSSLYLYQDR